MILEETKSDQINDALAEIPELEDSSYGKYPLNYSEWLTVRNDDDSAKIEGNPIFIASKTDQGQKQHYVYGKGPDGRIGYYHLLTKESYKILYGRVKPMIQPTGLGIFRKRQYTISSPKMRQRLELSLSIISERMKLKTPQEVAEEGLADTGAGLRQMNDLTGAIKFHGGWTGA